MYHFNTEQPKTNYPYAYFDSVFSDDEMDKIVNYANTLACENGKVSNDEEREDVEEFRKTNVAWIGYSENNLWFLNKYLSVVKHLNEQFYNFDINSFGNFQYTKYDEIGFKYDYHTDMPFATENFMRKLSSVLFLSKPEDYSGGKFLIKLSEKEFEVEQPRGRMIVFPSYIMHKVTPIESGERISLVNWFLGPHFK